MATNLGENFYPKLVQLASEVGMKPEDIIAVMVGEAGLNPSVVEKKFEGSGLIGFMPSTLNQLGYTGDWKSFTKLSGSEQLDWVKKFIEGAIKIAGRTFNSAAQYYTANFIPSASKLPGVKNSDPKAIFLEKNPEGAGPDDKFSKKYLDAGVQLLVKSESHYYNANKTFDKDNKGFITFGDIINHVEKIKQSSIYKSAIEELRKVVPEKTKEKLPIANEPANDSEDLIKELFNEFSKAASISNKSLFNKYLPTNYFTIQVAGNLNNSIEFSRILCAALDEELLSTSFIHKDKNNIEVECKIAGQKEFCKNAIAELTNIISNSFNIKTSIINKKSSYKPIQVKFADAQHREFCLKLLTRKK